MNPETPPIPRFKIGAVVSLTCEDFPMTVYCREYNAMTGHTYVCIWHAESGDILTSFNIPEAALKPIDP
jgi:hypothetical protein